MKLTTFGVSFKEENIQRKYEILKALDDTIFKNDPNWFFALHPKGITLRCSPKKTNRVIKFLKIREIKFKKDRHYYIPSKHEYYGVHTLGDDIVLILHALSVSLIRHTPKSYYIILERLNHLFINMTGMYDFYLESLIYLDLAEGRRRFLGLSLRYPYWVYKLYFKIFRRWN